MTCSIHSSQIGIPRLGSVSAVQIIVQQGRNINHKGWYLNHHQAAHKHPCHRQHQGWAACVELRDCQTPCTDGSYVIGSVVDVVNEDFDVLGKLLLCINWDGLDSVTYPSPHDTWSLLFASSAKSRIQSPVDNPPFSSIRLGNYFTDILFLVHFCLRSHDNKNCLAACRAKVDMTCSIHSCQIVIPRLGSVSAVQIIVQQGRNINHKGWYLNHHQAAHKHPCHRQHQGWAACVELRDCQTPCTDGSYVIGSVVDVVNEDFDVLGKLLLCINWDGLDSVTYPSPHDTWSLLFASSAKSRIQSPVDNPPFSSIRLGNYFTDILFLVHFCLRSHDNKNCLATCRAKVDMTCSIHSCQIVTPQLWSVSAVRDDLHATEVYVFTILGCSSTSLS